MPKRSAAAEVIRANRATPKPGEPVTVTLAGAAAPATGIVRRITTKAVVVKLDVPVFSLAGQVMFAADSEISIPRHPPASNDPAPAGFIVTPQNASEPGPAYLDPDGYPPSAPTPRNSQKFTTALREPFLTTITAQRSRLDALRSEAKAVEAELRLAEAQVVGALKAGATPPPGWQVRLDVETSSVVRPAWKQEALALAQQSGMDPQLYEDSVKARTQPSVTTRELLVVERAG